MNKITDVILDTHDNADDVINAMKNLGRPVTAMQIARAIHGRSLIYGDPRYHSTRQQLLRLEKYKEVIRSTVTEDRYKVTRFRLNIPNKKGD